MDKQQFKKLIIDDLTWKRMLKSLIFIYAFFAVYVYFLADSMIFVPQPSSYQPTFRTSLCSTVTSVISSRNRLNINT